MDEQPHVPVRQWPIGERPREKLIQNGAASLSDAELLALLLHTGTPGLSSLDLARQLLTRFDGLRGVFAAPFAEFSSGKGLGPAKYAVLQAILEMTQRVLGEDMRKGPALSSSSAVRDYLCLAMRDKPYEVFLGLFLDAQNRLIEARELFRGTLTESSVYPREVVKAALAANAAAVVLSHNHPFGLAEPSGADIQLTHTLQAALALVDIEIFDHIIVSGNQVYSFAEHGQL